MILELGLEGESIFLDSAAVSLFPRLPEETSIILTPLLSLCRCNQLLSLSQKTQAIKTPDLLTWMRKKQHVSIINSELTIE